MPNLKKLTKQRNPRPAKADRRAELGVLIDIVFKQGYKIDPANCTMVEIGSFKGKSTEVWCENFKKVYAIDPWQNGYDIEDDSSENESMEEVEKEFDARTEKYQNSGKLVKIKKTSMDAVNDFDDKSIDFVYIDGNHMFDFVNEDIINWRPKTKILGGHDFGWVDVEGIGSVFMACKINFDRPPDTILLDTSWVYDLENYDQYTKVQNKTTNFVNRVYKPCNCYGMSWENLLPNYEGVW